MGLKEKIDSICADVNISRTKLSKMLGITQASFNKSINNGKFRQSRLAAIGEKLGAQYYAYFTFDDGERFEIAGMDSILEIVKDICARYGIKLLNAAKTLGYTNSYNFAARLTTGLFSQEELEDIAAALGGKYECGFLLEDNSAEITLKNYNTVASQEALKEKQLTEAEKEKREQARLRKNARQREYAKRIGYNSNYDYVKNNTKTYTFRFVINTDADIIEHLDQQENRMGYIKNLIREDIRNKQNAKV